MIRLGLSQYYLQMITIWLSSYLLVAVSECCFTVQSVELGYACVRTM